MGSLTIHALDTELGARLSAAARRSKTSKNRLIKDLLAKAVGLRAADNVGDDYREFCGLWNEAAFADFMATQADNTRIDLEDWQ